MRHSILAHEWCPPSDIGKCNETRIAVPHSPQQTQARIGSMVWSTNTCLCMCPITNQWPLHHKAPTKGARKIHVHKPPGHVSLLISLRITVVILRAKILKTCQSLPVLPERQTQCWPMHTVKGFERSKFRIQISIPHANVCRQQMFFLHLGQGKNHAVVQVAAIPMCPLSVLNSYRRRLF